MNLNLATVEKGEMFRIICEGTPLTQLTDLTSRTRKRSEKVSFACQPGKRGVSVVAAGMSCRLAR